MYVTRPLSYYRKFPEALKTPPEGPYSGFLVIQDEDSERYSCFGLCKNPFLENLPFPQNKELTVRYMKGQRPNSYPQDDYVMFIPVLNQPLSSNRYYAIRRNGPYKGEALTCSREKHMKRSCFCRHVRDVIPRPLDPHSVYQQFKIQFYVRDRDDGSFRGLSMAPDGFPPSCLRRPGWSVRAKTPKNYRLLEEASGLNASLRQVLPDFDSGSKPLVVGKWYIPFMFVKDGYSLRNQMEISRFYEVTLERKWERIFACQNNKNEQCKSNVNVDVVVGSEIAYVAGNNAVWDESVDGVVWFRCVGREGEESSRSVGLRVEVVRRMKWEEKRSGRLGGEKNRVRVQRVDKFGDDDGGGWSEFGCYVLVESFVLRRMDGSLVMSMISGALTKLGANGNEVNYAIHI